VIIGLRLLSNLRRTLSMNNTIFMVSNSTVGLGGTEPEASRF
jgi:hypothetical protein